MEVNIQRVSFEYTTGMWAAYLPAMESHARPRAIRRLDVSCVRVYVLVLRFERYKWTRLAWISHPSLMISGTLRPSWISEKWLKNQWRVTDSPEVKCWLMVNQSPVTDFKSYFTDSRSLERATDNQWRMTDSGWVKVQPLIVNLYLILSAFRE